jgi:hypothetical protein
MRLPWTLVVAILAGCPAKRTDPVVAPAAGAGCPTASGVHVASYAQPPEGEQGHTGWVLPLHDAQVASIEGQPGYAPLDPAAAAAAGVPTPPRTIWLLPPNAPMCQATVGSFYAAAIDAPTPNIAYGVELTGCPAPSDASDAVAIALISDAPPSDCRAYPPRPIASRLGELDQANQWTPPTKETPIPPALDKLIPVKDCTAPTCEKLWSIAQVEIDHKPVAWAGAVNWVTGTMCPYQTEAWSGFFLAGPDGTAVQITDGQDHPLALTVVLADSTGRRVLLAQGTGEYTAYDLANGAATVGRHLVWLVAGPEAYQDLDHLGPECPGP